MAEEGNPASVSDAAVGALAIRAAVIGACLNVKINAASLKDQEKAHLLTEEADDIVKKAVEQEQEIIQIAERKIQS
jgi:glutamate formiminotransferase/formiminotetrahydrofolate cyclodeaminase